MFKRLLLLLGLGFTLALAPPVFADDELVLNETTPLYTSPDLSSPSDAALAPQTIHPIQLKGTWVHISTWEGDRWFPSTYGTIVGNIVKTDQQLLLTKETPLVVFPMQDLDSYASLSPQKVHVIGIWGDHWYEIETWIGTMWIQAE